MSSRFHNKYHRHNHHTLSIEDPRYPDAGHDPIASPDSPFLGDFVMRGSLSATVVPIPFSPFLSASPAGTFTGNYYGVRAIAPSGIAVDAIGDVSVTGNLSANNIYFTGNVINTYTQPVTATGDFLEVKIGNQTRAIRLWQLP
jgi:hypothetical protein